MKKIWLFIILLGQNVYGMKRFESEDANEYSVKKIKYELQGEVISVNGTGSNTKVTKLTISGIQLFSLQGAFINQNNSPKNIDNDAKKNIDNEVEKVISLLYKKYGPQDKRDANRENT